MMIQISLRIAHQNQKHTIRVRQDAEGSTEEAMGPSTTVKEREQAMVDASGRRIAAVVDLDLLEPSARTHDYVKKLYCGKTMPNETRGNERGTCSKIVLLHECHSHGQSM